MKAALALAVGDRWALGVGAVTTAATGALFAITGQMLASADGRIVLLTTAAKAAIFAGLAVLAGAVGVVHTCALRLRLRRSGRNSAVLGLLSALVGASCCTPLVWPAVLSLLGVSGVTLLGINADLHRWFWVPVAVAVFALAAGMSQALRAIAAPCAVGPPSDGAAGWLAHLAREVQNDDPTTVRNAKGG